MKIARYLLVRVCIFLVCSFVLGFSMRRMVGTTFSHGLSTFRIVMKDIGMGTFITLFLTGGFAIVKALPAIGLGGHEHWVTTLGNGSDNVYTVQFVLICCVGALILIWKLITGLLELAKAGHTLTLVNMRLASKGMRKNVVERYRVLNRADTPRARCN